MKTPKRQNRAAFTFVEMLIVTSILAVVSLAIYAAFNNGVKIWQKINAQTHEEDLNIFFGKFTTDLKNSFRFTEIDFLGESDELQFSTLVNSRRLGKRTAGEVIYSYDSMRGIISREERDYSAIYRDEDGEITRLAGDIDSLEFRYYFYDADVDEYIWLDEWDEEEGRIPLAVKVELKVGDGAETVKFVKTVDIPTGI